MNRLIFILPFILFSPLSFSLEYHTSCTSRYATKICEINHSGEPGYLHCNNSTVVIYEGAGVSGFVPKYSVGTYNDIYLYGDKYCTADNSDDEKDATHVVEACDGRTNYIHLNVDQSGAYADCQGYSSGSCQEGSNAYGNYIVEMTATGQCLSEPDTWYYNVNTGDTTIDTTNLETAMAGVANKVDSVGSKVDLLSSQVSLASNTIGSINNTVNGIDLNVSGLKQDLSFVAGDVSFLGDGQQNLIAGQDLIQSGIADNRVAIDSMVAGVDASITPSLSAIQSSVNVASSDAWNIWEASKGFLADNKRDVWAIWYANKDYLDANKKDTWDIWEASKQRLDQGLANDQVLTSSLNTKYQSLLDQIDSARPDLQPLVSGQGLVAADVAGNKTAIDSVALGVTGNKSALDSLSLGVSGSKAAIDSVAAGMDENYLSLLGQIESVRPDYQPLLSGQDLVVADVADNKTAIDSVALGVTDNRSALDSLSLGVSGSKTAIDSVAIGVSGNKTAIDSMALGVVDNKAAIDSVAIGVSGNKTAIDSLASGMNTQTLPSLSAIQSSINVAGSDRWNIWEASKGFLADNKRDVWAIWYANKDYLDANKKDTWDIWEASKQRLDDGLVNDQSLALSVADNKSSINGLASGQLNLTTQIYSSRDSLQRSIDSKPSINDQTDITQTLLEDTVGALNDFLSGESDSAVTAVTDAVQGIGADAMEAGGFNPGSVFNEMIDDVVSVFRSRPCMPLVYSALGQQMEITCETSSRIKKLLSWIFSLYTLLACAEILLTPVRPKFE